MSNLAQAVQDMVAVVQKQVEQKKYLRNFFDKASRWDLFLSYLYIATNPKDISLIIMKFTNSLVKSRPLKERGAEQVSDDVSALFAQHLLTYPTVVVRSPGTSIVSLEDAWKSVN